MIAHITQAMSQGEIDQMEQKGRPDLSEAEYNQIIEQKTAVLIQGACQSGAIIAQASPEKEAALKDYGYHMGMAFQMADDLLDYTATAEQLGKNPGADMREGKLTLPLIHSLAKAGDEDRKWILDTMAQVDFDALRFDGLKQRLTDLGGLAYTQDRAVTHVNAAKASIDIFEDSTSKQLLTLIADYSIQRKV